MQKFRIVQHIFVHSVQHVIPGQYTALSPYTEPRQVYSSSSPLPFGASEGERLHGFPSSLSGLRVGGTGRSANSFSSPPGMFGPFEPTGACPYNRPCAQQYVGKSQSGMVISGRLIVQTCQTFGARSCCARRCVLTCCALFCLLHLPCDSV